MTGLLSNSCSHQSDGTFVPGHDLDDQDRRIVERVDEYLAAGLNLKRWWDRIYPANSFKQRFELQRLFNRPGRSFGFFDEVICDDKTLPVMGNFQEMFYDQPRTPTSFQHEAAEWMRAQVREFVLRYFMRVSSFSQPAAYVESEPANLPRYLEGLSWCPGRAIPRQGFGFSQLYYKLRETGQIGKFEDEFAIIDLRELGEKYEWIVCRVRIFDFKFTFKPLGPDGPELSFPLTEKSYLVLTGDFVANENESAPGMLGRYGLGYAFIKDPTHGEAVYGPGQFDAAVELIEFQVTESGEVKVSMAFVVNRPEKILNLSLNPLSWGLSFADLFSLGLTSRFTAPAEAAIRTMPFSAGGFDPVTTFISLANMFSGQCAARDLCISKEQLEKDLLSQHFTQHYATIVGSLLTWRQIPDWLDPARLPEWVLTGRSS